MMCLNSGSLADAGLVMLIHLERKRLCISAKRNQKPGLTQTISGTSVKCLQFSHHKTLVEWAMF